MTDPASLNRLLTLLQGSWLFRSLGRDVLVSLAEQLELHVYQGGSLIFRQGDLSDSMIIVVSGRLRVSVRRADGTIDLFNEISPGEAVGETGLILSQPRTADVVAIRDSTVAVLGRDQFETLLARYPLEINRVFAQAIFNHLRHTPQEKDTKVEQRFVVVPLSSGMSSRSVASGLVEALSAMGRVHHVPDAGHWRAETVRPELGGWQDRCGDIERTVDFLVFEADDRLSDWTRRVVRQADQVIFVDDARMPVNSERLDEALATEPGAAFRRSHRVILHDADARFPEAQRCAAAGSGIERNYPLREGRVDDFSRLARFLTGKAIGVVLGGGGARGFAHLGVIRALEEARLPIDLLGGNSMGALIGAQYACGIPLDEIRERIVRFAKGGERPTIPVLALLSGKRMQRGLQELFGERTFESLWQPFFAAACNLSRAMTTVQDSGPIWRAVLASNSPAGLLPPVVHEGDLLVDGAILDNVPVAAMRARLGTPREKRRGNGTVIAIDVDVAQEFSVPREQTSLSTWGTVKGYFSATRERMPAIGPILYRAGHIGGLAQRDRTMALADYYLQPPVAHFPLMGYERAAEIVAVGYDYAQEQMTKWT